MPSISHIWYVPHNGELSHWPFRDLEALWFHVLLCTIPLSSTPNPPQILKPFLWSFLDSRHYWLLCREIPFHFQAKQRLKKFFLIKNLKITKRCKDNLWTIAFYRFIHRAEILTMIQNSWVIHQPLSALSNEMNFWKKFSFSLIPSFSYWCEHILRLGLVCTSLQKPNKGKTPEFREIHRSSETSDHHCLRSLGTWVFIPGCATNKQGYLGIFVWFLWGWALYIIRRHAV